MPGRQQVHLNMSYTQPAAHCGEFIYKQTAL